MGIAKLFRPLLLTNGLVGVTRKPTLYVDTVLGSNTKSGTSWSSAKATMAAAFAIVEDDAIIYVRGDVREQILAPLGVQGVAIIGASGGNNHHDDAVRWRVAATPVADTPLLTLREQGWEVQHILFVPDANAVVGVRLRRAESATYPDASHAIIRDCRFIGATGKGVENHGGVSQITVEDCIFDGLTTGIGHTGGAGIDSPNRWRIERNTFKGNTNHITLPGYDCLVKDNVFLTDAGTDNVNLSGGVAGGNMVLMNFFATAEASIANSNGYAGGSVGNDGQWRNYSNNTAAMTVGIPGA